MVKINKKRIDFVSDLDKMRKVYFLESDNKGYVLCFIRRKTEVMPKKVDVDAYKVSINICYLCRIFEREKKISRFT